MKSFLMICWMGWCFSLSAAQDSTATPVTTNKDPLSLGNTLYEKGDYPAAAEQYRNAARSTAPGLQRAFAWFNLGNCHVRTKALHKAVVAYRRSVEDAPNFSRGWQLLGDVAFTVGAWAEAAVAYRRLLELEEGSIHARRMLGECALKAGDYADALRHFDAAIKAEPDLPEVHMAMAEAYASIRDYSSAEKVLEEAMLEMSQPSAEGYFYLGQLYELDENSRRAVRAYEEGLLLQPLRADYYLRIVGIHEQSGDDFLALLTLEQGYRAGIRRADFPLRSGAILFRQGRLDRALEEFRKAYVLGDPRGRTGIENVAAAYYNAGKKGRGDEVMGRVTKFSK